MDHGGRPPHATGVGLTAPTPTHMQKYTILRCGEGRGERKRRRDSRRMRAASVRRRLHGICSHVDAPLVVCVCVVYVYVYAATASSHNTLST